MINTTKQERVFLDNAATTPLDKRVLEAMTEAMQNMYGNPSSIHTEGRIARAAIEQARKTVAHHLKASIGEIFFTSGGTESNNMALKCAVRDLGVRRIVSSSIEHHCVLHSIEQLQTQTGVEVVWVRLTDTGSVDYHDLEDILQRSTKKTLVSLMHANNEVGTLLDLPRVSQLCQTYDALFHSDTVQTVAHLPIDVSKNPIHFLSGAAHKFHGPKGIGFIYINGDNTLKPFIDGGAQERNMRGGTENFYGIIGLAKAIELAHEEMETRQQHISNLKQHLLSQLKATFGEKVCINGDIDNSLYTVLSVSFPTATNADLLLLSLDIEGVSVSGGSACSSGADAGSHVLNEIKGDPNLKMIRFSFSHFNNQTELDSVVKRLEKILVF